MKLGSWLELALFTLAVLTSALLIRRERADIYDLKHRLETAQRELSDTEPQIGDDLSNARFTPLITQRGNQNKQLLVFFSVHCDPCVHEIPYWPQFSQQIARKGYTFTAVSLDSADEIKRYFNYPVQFSIEIADPSVVRQLRLRTIPYAIALSTTNRVTWVSAGQMGQASLKNALVSIK